MTSKQRAYLKSLAMTMDAIFQIGKASLTPEIISALDEALENIISKVAPYGLKVLGNGNLEKNLTVKAAKFSETAIQKITKAGGKAEVL